MIKLKDNYLAIDDNALIERLINLGVGVEESKETKLPLLEAAYFAEKNIISFDKEKILEQARKSDNLAYDKYTVLKCLRNNGYITRVSLDTNDYFRVHRKGIRVGEDRTHYLLKVVPSNWQTNMKEIKEAIAFAGKLRKELVIAYVDSDKDVHFIKFSRTSFE